MDPTSEYLTPPLQGFRLAGKRYTEIVPDDRGALECRELDLSLRVEEGRLSVYDQATGLPLRTESEAEREARQAAEARADAEAQAREAAEAELRRLREKLKELGGDE